MRGNVTKAVGHCAVGKVIINNLKETERSKKDLVASRRKFPNQNPEDDLAATFSRVQRGVDVVRVLNVSTSSVRAARANVAVAGVTVIQEAFQSWADICMGGSTWVLAWVDGWYCAVEACTGGCGRRCGGM